MNEPFTTWLVLAGELGAVIGALVLGLRLLLRGSGGNLWAGDSRSVGTRFFDQLNADRHDPRKQSWYNPARPSWRPGTWDRADETPTDDALSEELRLEHIRCRNLPGGDLPAAADAEFDAELRRRFGSMPEPTRPVVLPPGDKRRITPED